MRDNRETVFFPTVFFTESVSIEVVRCHIKLKFGLEYTPNWKNIKGKLQL
jgi:hypothetical protein